MEGSIAQQAQLIIINPIAESQTDLDPTLRHAPAPRPATLDGKVVALYWNGKANGLDALVRVRQRLDKRFKNLTFVEMTGEGGGVLRHMSKEQIDQLQNTVDAVVGTTGDCGSCTSWLMHDLCELEKRGIPTAGYTAATFDEDARFSCKIFGVPEAAPLIVPECFSNKAPEDIHQMVDDSFETLVGFLTLDRPILTAPPTFESVVLDASPELMFRGRDLLEAFDAMQAKFVQNAWSDGLPLIPPTPEKVEAMIRASGKDGSEVIGIFAPGFGVGTIRKVAANAVMAGCRPEAMPVILAMLDCVLDPSLGLRTWAMSTGPQAPLVCVSGPIADEIGMNHGCCALGPASISQVNVALGRALRLIVMNIGLSYPNVSDMDTIGTPMKFSACVAENEERTPWQSFREQMGFSKDESTVTVNVPYGISELFDFKNTTPELLIDTFASLTRNTSGSPSMGEWLIKTDAPLSAGYPFHGKVSNLTLLAPDHASVFGNAGWGPKDIAAALHEKTKLSFHELMLNQDFESFHKAHPELKWLEQSPETLLHVMPEVDSWEFFVVGASAGRSQYCFGGTHSVTKAVRPV